MNLILLGPPGAGKGTQGALLASHFDVPRIATGDLLRDAVRRGTPLGRKAQSYMDAGELVPDPVILGLVREVLEDHAGSDSDSDAEAADSGGSPGAIFDGFPRNIPQAEALDGLLEELNMTLDAVILVDVPDDVLVKRLSGRRSCPECGKVHNIHYDPPSEEGVCDRCGGTLVERADDAPETVRKRLTVYRQSTEPLIAFYDDSPTPVRRVDGDGPVEIVQKRILEELGG